MQIGSYLPTFREYITVPSSRVKQSMEVGPLALEDGPDRQSPKRRYMIINLRLVRSRNTEDLFST